MSELLRNFSYRVRGWRDVWAWFMVSGGLRLWVAVGSIAYLLFQWWA